MKHLGLCLFVAAVAALSCRSSWGQSGDENGALRGMLHGNFTGVAHVVVSLSELQTSRVVASSDVEADGSFELRGIQGGSYRLAVLEDSFTPSYQQIVLVLGSHQNIDVQVPPRQKPPAGQTVSAYELLHPPSKKAMEAFTAARKSADGGDYNKAANLLQKALSLSPDYADAWVNLGAQHIRMGNYQQALAELQHAAELEKPTPIILGNIACVQHILHHNDEAMQAAKQALQLDGSYPQAHLILGLLLTANTRTLPEAVKHLAFAARTIPAAQNLLDQVRTAVAAAHE